MAKVKQNWWAFGLEMLAALLFFATWSALWNGGIVSPVFSGVGGFWLPLVVGFSFIGTAALFLLSFSNIPMGWGKMDMNAMKMMNMWVLKATFITALSLSAWAFPDGTWVWTSMLGFAFGFVGTWVASKDM